MTIPTLGHPEIWPKLAPRLVKYLKPKLGKPIKMPVKKGTNKLK